MVAPAHLLRHPQALTAAGAGALAVVAAVIVFGRRRRISPEEREERRRTRLAASGRIIDGTLVESTQSDPDAAPHALIYRYRVSGVEYECGQDISALATRIPPLGPESILFGTPVQVRYDRDNPADSIIVAETWNGLWNQDYSHTEHVHGRPERPGLH